MEKRGYIKRVQRAAATRKKVYILLTPKGRRLRTHLVPLAEAVNSIAVRGVKAADIVTARAVLLAIIENMVADAQRADRRMPSTRELARLAPTKRPSRMRKRALQAR